MARRYGGKFSPQAGDDRVDPPIDPVGAKENLLFLVPVVVAVTSVGRGPTGLVLGLASAAVLGLGVWLLREGLRAEAAYDARKVARRPGLPRKMLAAALAGIGIALAGYLAGAGIIGGVLYGMATGALHLAAFGIDPLADKRMEGIDTFQQDRVARVVDEAEAYLKAMSDQIEALGDRPLMSRVAAFQRAARKMIRTVEEDPRDLTGARKFLGVYLMGARDATVKFAELYRRSRNDDARADYEALLSDLETNFAARTEKMMLDDRSDMDIEIKVLRDRLQREGL